MTKEQKHFVAVHGVCHGAWVYYKLKPRVEAAGHKFTAVDLAASGANEKNLNDVTSMVEYTKPLLDVLAAIPDDEKVILVGHSGGGMAAALGMEKFPEKISVSVFVCAIMPDSTNSPSFILEKYSAGTPPDAWKDCQFGAISDPPITSLRVGPEFLKSFLYTKCPVEDFTLATLLTKRPGSLYIEDLMKADKFTEKGFGSVPRVYVVCPEDECIPAVFQKFMIENNPVVEVKEIPGADHMPMLSKPDELAKCFVEIAETYA